MRNCLVTKLKGTVENSDLPVMGGAIFEVTSKTDGTYDDYFFRIYAENAHQSVIKAEGGTFQIVGSSNWKHLTELDVLALSEKWADNAVYPDGESWTKIRYTVNDVYNIKFIDMGNQLTVVNGLSSLLDYSVIEGFTFRSSGLDLGSCKCGTLTKLAAPSGSIASGNWHDIIANNPRLTNLSIWDNNVDLPNNIINSSIENLAGFRGNLSGLPTTITLLKSDLFSGSLNDYVTRLRAAGRTTGNITLVLAQNSQMTLDNVNISTWCSNHSITPANYMYLVWTSDSIILTLTQPA